MGSFGGVTLTDLSTPVFWFGVVSIILIDLVLSGDNAVLIAMACRNLPKELQAKGILFGTLGAIGLRVIFATLAVTLLNIPFLKAIGGLILVWIAIKLMSEVDSEQEDIAAPDRLWAAVKTIIVADAVMSLDNIIAIAGAAQGKVALLWFGLLVSIPLVVFGSRILVVLMNKFSWIIALGAGILGWTAGHMLITDIKILQYFGNFLKLPFMLNGQLISLFLAAAVIVAGIFIKKERMRSKVVRTKKDIATKRC